MQPCERYEETDEEMGGTEDEKKEDPADVPKGIPEFWLSAMKDRPLPVFGPARSTPERPRRGRAGRSTSPSRSRWPLAELRAG